MSKGEELRSQECVDIEYRIEKLANEISLAEDGSDEARREINLPCMPGAPN